MYLTWVYICLVIVRLIYLKDAKMSVGGFSEHLVLGKLEEL